MCEQKVANIEQVYINKGYLALDQLSSMSPNTDLSAREPSNVPAVHFHDLPGHIFK